MKKRLSYILPVFILLVSVTLSAGASVSPEKRSADDGAIFTEQIVASFINELIVSDADTHGLSDYSTRKFVVKIREGLEKIREGFVIKHIADNISTTDYYNEKVQWTGSIKRYYENRLPDEVRNLVKRKFCAYQITSVEEVETVESNEIPTYIIHLENDKNIKFLKVNNGEVQVWKDIAKLNF